MPGQAWQTGHLRKKHWPKVQTKVNMWPCVIYMNICTDFLSSLSHVHQGLNLDDCCTTYDQIERSQSHGPYQDVCSAFKEEEEIQLEKPWRNGEKQERDEIRKRVGECCVYFNSCSCVIWILVCILLSLQVQMSSVLSSAQCYTFFFIRWNKINLKIYKVFIIS